MDDVAIVADLFRCPRCEGELAADAPLRCVGCGTVFGEVGGIGWLRVAPERERARWRAGAHALAGRTERNLAALRHAGEHASAARPPATKDRLDRLAAGLVSHSAAVTTWLTAAGLGPVAGPDPAAVTEGAVQTLRDWAWEGGAHPENAEALALLERVLPEELGRVLVVGAGACRLAVDLHETGRPALTVALDVNVVPMLVARRIVGGEGVRLWEFPGTPADGASVAVARDAPGRPVRPGFVQVFADGLALPVRDGAFDTVLTPWFVDQVPADLAAWLPTVHRALRPGGCWLDVGPLIYPETLPPGRRYALDEVVALSARAGLAVEAVHTERTRYLCSPASAQGRLEDVHALRARRDDRPPVRPPPPWLLHAVLPVPRFDALERYRPGNPVLGAVVSAIDGTRTTEDIAAHLVRTTGIPERGAVRGVQLSLRQIARDCGVPGA